MAYLDENGVITLTADIKARSDATYAPINHWHIDLEEAIENVESDIESLQSAVAGGISFSGETVTELFDGSTVSTIVIDGNYVPVKKGLFVISRNKEYVFDGSKWVELGDLSSIGRLGFKDNASATYTPSGSVAAPTISLNTAGNTTTVNSITGVGTLPSLNMALNNETLSFSWSAGTLPTKGSDTTVKTGDAVYVASTPTFTGTQTTITVS